MAAIPNHQRGDLRIAAAQRLLDPAPAGNCKLQTLRQYYRLPESRAPLLKWRFARGFNGDKNEH